MHTNAHEPNVFTHCLRHYSYIHTLTHSPTYIFTHSSIHPPTHLPIHPPPYLTTHQSTCLSFYSSTHTSIYPSTHPPTFSHIRLFSNPSIYPFIYSYSNQPIHSSPNPPIHPLTSPLVHSIVSHITYLGGYSSSEPPRGNNAGHNLSNNFGGMRNNQNLRKEKNNFTFLFTKKRYC